MKAAFSRLQGVQELALSIDSGLGWLHGPDVSLYCRTFKQASHVFGRSYAVHGRREENLRDFWALLKDLAPEEFSSFVNSDALWPDLIAKHSALPITDEMFIKLMRNSSSQGLLPKTIPLVDVSSIASAQRDGLLKQTEYADSTSITFERDIPDDPRKYLSGIVALQDVGSTRTFRDTPMHLRPNSLTSPQLEWLLETKWAQQAFLSSYMIAIIDNPTSFETVHTLTLARISSQYLTSLNRDDFWDSLPHLRRVTVLALAEWRDVHKDAALYVSSTDRSPMASCGPLANLLRYCIAKRPIEVLNIGWATGGEYETGYYGRNQHIMPAPILNTLVRGAESPEDLLLTFQFPFVEELTLTNCWIPPTALLCFMKQHSEKLQHLSLDSVSLTRQPDDVPWLAEDIRESSYSRDETRNAEPQWLQNQVTQSDEQRSSRNYLRTSALPMPVPISVTQPFTSRAVPGWEGPHDRGSWPWVLEAISPFGTARAPLSEPNYRFAAGSILATGSPLKMLTLRSCGYAMLVNAVFDQPGLTDVTPTRSARSWVRIKSISKYMMNGEIYGLATIAQHIDDKETCALRRVWGCTQGPWQGDVENACMDGWLPYGSGRFSAIIEKD
jgi:hypothetical protein